jgi:class 3 adenylate cyclase/predicted ATPase
MRCPQCQRETPPDAQFCPKCGTKLAIVCAHCGSDNGAGGAFCRQCGEPLDTTSRSAGPIHLAGASYPSPDAERRQITIMFCDLVGSTALAQRLDPEELRDLMQAYQRVCGAVVARYEGHVAQYLGDAVMVYFGWPQAHEDDAQRSVRAGLEILDAIKVVRPLEPLQVRIGVATGPVVIGETGAGDAAAPKVAVGEAPNLASRVQGLAGMNEIVIASTTHELAGGSFEYEYLGEHVLKGMHEPVRAWRVLGRSRAEGPFEAAHGVALTPLVGRETEIAMLLDIWAQAKRGEGRVVQVCGEPGIGKSRLTQELCTLIAEQPHLRLHYQCWHYYTNSAFYPVITQIERAAGFDRSDAPAAKLDKLEAALAPLGSLGARVAPLYAALLSLPLDRYPPLTLSARKQKEETIKALTEVVIALSASKPVLIIFEDAHWLDPTTLEALSAVVDGTREARVLLLVTYRPEFEPPWVGRNHVAVLSLNRLTRRQSAQLIETVTEGKALPNEIVEQIVAKTDGVPLFVEEVTKNVLESDLLMNEADRYVPKGRLSGLEIPATLKDSLTARLGQLGATKKLAQIGAVFGRQFRHEMVAPLSGLVSGELARSLRQLVRSGLVWQRGVSPDAIYTFRHALVQEAAYESLLKSERQVLHRRAGEILSERFPETAESEPELLAYHYAAGNVNEKAAQYWLKAGQKAWQRSAVKEAIAHLTHGLESVEMIADAARRESLELRLQSVLGVVYFAAISYASPEAQAAFLRAYELCQRMRDPELQVPVLYGIGAFQIMKGDIKAGHDVFEKLMAVAKAFNQPRFLLYTHSMLAWSNYNRANYARAIEHADQVLALYDAEAQGDPRLSAADPKVISECFRATALWSLGFPDQASATGEALLEHARALGDPYTLAYTLNFAAVWVPELRGEYQRVFDRAAEGIELARKLGYPFMEMFGTLERAWAMSQSRDPFEALAVQDEALEKYRAHGVRFHYPHLLARRASLLIRVGRVDSAQATAAEALTHLEQSGERSIEVEVHQTRGDALRAGGMHRWAEAEACYSRAIEVAREQKAKSWELRAATSLARLWQDQGRRRQAWDVLAQIYDWFTEGFGTRDLQDAKALLDQLS